MRAVIITIGDELLIGQTVDTNSAWMGSELTKLGFDIYRIISIHDTRKDILETLGSVTGKNDLVLITGGLGPTSDDITKQTLCEFFNTQLVTNHDILKMIEDRMTRRNFPMNDKNRQQADVPESCKVLHNQKGTAPGMWFEKDSTVIVSMPGVPYEMKFIMEEHVIPELKKRFTSQVIIHRNIMTYGTFEARLSELLTGFEKELPENIKLAYLPSLGVIKLRLTATGSNENHLTEQLNNEIEKLYGIIPEYIYGENEEQLEMTIGNILKKKRLTLCTAESCTGGNIAAMITSVPGSSTYYKGSVIAYDNAIKSNLLGIEENLLKLYGAVSEEVVSGMAEGARILFSTDFALATSGIAGPTGGSEEKPVGTIWIAVASKAGTVTKRVRFGDERISNIYRFSVESLNLLRKQIINY